MDFVTDAFELPNYKWLLDRIDSGSAFVNALAAVACITWRQREHLTNIVQHCAFQPTKTIINCL